MNHGPLVLEATALPTEPQPLPAAFSYLTQINKNILFQILSPFNYLLTRQHHPTPTLLTRGPVRADLPPPPEHQHRGRRRQHGRKFRSFKNVRKCLILNPAISKFYSIVSIPMFNKTTKVKKETSGLTS